MWVGCDMFRLILGNRGKRGMDMTDGWIDGGNRARMTQVWMDEWTSSVAYPFRIFALVAQKTQLIRQNL